VDPVAAAGFEAAAREALSSPRRWLAIAPLRDALERGLLALSPGARVNGAAAPRAAHVTNVAFPGWSGPEIVAALDLEGVSVSSGSACSAGTSEPSPVLLAMGDSAAAGSSVRFSLGEDTTLEDVEYTLAAMDRVLRRA
jgi:cysteine desulfurase